MWRLSLWRSNCASILQKVQNELLVVGGFLFPSFVQYNFRQAFRNYKRCKVGELAQGIEVYPDARRHTCGFEWMPECQLFR